MWDPQALEVFTSDPLEDTTVLPAASNQDDIKCAVNAAFSSLSVRPTAPLTHMYRARPTQNRRPRCTLTSPPIHPPPFRLDVQVTASAGQTLYVRVSGASTYGGTISITSTCSVY